MKIEYACFWLLVIIVICNPVRENYFGKEKTVGIRGALALLVFFSHVLRYCGRYGVLQNFVYAGTAAVSGFFFLSGYGLMKKGMVDGEQYALKVCKKTLHLCLVLMLYTGIYLAMDVVSSDLQSIAEYWRAFVQEGDLLIDYSWFMIVILYFYLIFILSLKLCHKNVAAILCVSLIGSGIYIFSVYKLTGWGDGWVANGLCFFIGQCWAVGQKWTDVWLKNRKIAICTGSIFVLLISVAESVLAREQKTTAALITMFTVMALLFALLSMRVDFSKNQFMVYIGKISLHFYLIQGLVLRIWRNNRIYIENEMIYFGVSLISTIIAATVIAWLYEQVRKWCKHERVSEG